MRDFIKKFFGQQTDDHAAGASKNFHYWLSLCLVGALLCLPVLSSAYAPLVDYPNHLARVYILYHYDETPAFQQRYDKIFEPIPNVAIDLIMVSLQRFVDILTAGKIFLLMTVAVFVAGCHKLGKTIHGHPTWLVLPCCFFIYNTMFLWGFVNYILGVSLFCLAFAYWLRRRDDWTWISLLASSFLVFCCYLSHLSAYVFLGVSFVVVEAWHFAFRRVSLRSVGLGLIPLVPSLVTFAVFMRSSGQIGTIKWNTLLGKVINSLSLVVSYNYALDAILIVGMLVIVALLIKLSERIRVVWPIFIAGGAFAFLYLLCPYTLFTSEAADKRFILPAALLLLLSLKIEPPASSAKYLLLAYLIIASIRIGAIWNTWMTLDRRIVAEVERLKGLPQGSSVYVASPPTVIGQKAKMERAFSHIAHYATIYRGSFVSGLFAFRGQQPLVTRPAPNYTFDYIWGYGESSSIIKNTQAERNLIVNDTDGFVLLKSDRVVK
jgi:hypothetical protein